MYNYYTFVLNLSIYVSMLSLIIFRHYLYSLYYGNITAGQLLHNTYYRKILNLNS